MKQQYKSLVALVAFVLVGTKVRADGIAPVGSQNVKTGLEKIQSRTQSDPALASVVPLLTKPQIEALIEQDLSDGDFHDLQKLLAELGALNTPFEMTNPGNVVLGTQEIQGGPAL